MTFAESLCERFGVDRLVFAVDSRGGRVAIHGWKTITDIEPAAMMRAARAVLFRLSLHSHRYRRIAEGNSHGCHSRFTAADFATADRGRRHSPPPRKSKNSTNGRRRGGGHGDLLGLAGDLSRTNGQEITKLAPATKGRWDLHPVGLPCEFR